MVQILSTPYNAGKLIYRALCLGEREIADSEHRELVSEYLSNPQFRQMVEDVARGLQLSILDSSRSGLVIAPTSAESRFAVKMSDFRSTLTPNQKAGLLLCHISVAATFFPTSGAIEDESYTSSPASVKDFSNNLLSFLHRLKEIGAVDRDDDGILLSGWQHLLTLPISNPDSERAGVGSLTGLLRITLGQMEKGGLVSIERKSMNADNTLYTPTFRLRVHLREFALQQIYELAQPRKKGQPLEKVAQEKLSGEAITGKTERMNE